MGDDLRESGMERLGKPTIVPECRPERRAHARRSRGRTGEARSDWPMALQVWRSKAGRGGAARVRRGVRARRAVHPHALVGALESVLGGTREMANARPGEGRALNVFAPVTCRPQESSEDFLRVLARGGRGTEGEARPRRKGRVCCWPPPA